MRRNRKWLIVFVVSSLLAASCSSLPGLRVLSGEDNADVEADSIAQNLDLVMANKSGDVNVSMLAAADRLEAAAGNVDVVEMREDLQKDSFIIYMMLRPAGDPSSDNLQQVVDYYNSLRRAVELTWQSVMRESERSGLLRIEVLSPQVISTLDNGLSSIGFTQLVVEIERQKAINYLARPHTLDDFIALIVDGTMFFDSPSDGPSLYTGEPNHPLFMLGSG